MCLINFTKKCQINILIKNVKRENMAIKETELATKYYNELRQLKEFKPINECFISIPVKGTELQGVDIEGLKGELKMLGVFVDVKESVDENDIIYRPEERLFIALFPIED